MVEVEEAEPVSLRDGGVAADCIVLVRHPHDQYYVKCRFCCLEEFGHDGLHAWNKRRDKERIGSNFITITHRGEREGAEIINSNNDGRR